MSDIDSSPLLVAGAVSPRAHVSNVCGRVWHSYVVQDSRNFQTLSPPNASDEIVVVGAGGFARETIEAIRAQSMLRGDGARLIGVVDSKPSDFNLARLASLGVQYLGTDEAWLASRPTADFVVGIGDPRIRSRIHQQFSDAGLRPATVIHPSAGLSSNCVIAPGTVICAGVQVSSFVTLGLHSHLNPNVTIGHDVVLDDFVSVNPGAILSGFVNCHSEVLVGAGATVLQGLTVGRGSTVGAMACVTRNIPAHRVAVGVPARWSTERES